MENEGGRRRAERGVANWRARVCKPKILKCRVKGRCTPTTRKGGRESSMRRLLLLHSGTNNLGKALGLAVGERGGRCGGKRYHKPSSKAVDSLKREKGALGLFEMPRKGSI